MKGSMGIAMLAMITMALLMVHPSEAITCDQLGGMLSPCLGYLRSSGSSPSKECCDGARKVQQATGSQADRRTAGNCAKNAAGRLQIKQDAAAKLPSACGISTSIPINPGVNCNNIGCAWQL